MDIMKKLETLMWQSRVNVIISGSTCSGKTTLSSRILSHFADKYLVTTVCQDSYFKNLPDIPRLNGRCLTDSIDAFHVSEFKSDVQLLLTNGICFMPIYDISKNTRVCKDMVVRAGKINIFEGLHTISLLPNIGNSIKIFVDTDIDTCLKRRIERDSQRFNVPKEKIRLHWKECIVPMYERYIIPQKQLAVVVINGDGGEFF